MPRIIFIKILQKIKRGCLTKAQKNERRREPTLVFCCKIELMKNKKQRYNNIVKEQAFQLMLPMDVGVKIEASAPVRQLLEITERMDYSRLNVAYKRLPHAKEASPKQMFQLTILGFRKGSTPPENWKKPVKMT